MECRAEINRFAIFLFCLLVPLGSMAPTERKMTTGQRQNNFTPEIPTFAFIIQKKAHALLEFYQECVSETFCSEYWRGPSEGRDMADSIPRCPAFQADCCALHHISSALSTLQGSIETICTSNSTSVVQDNLKQLNTTLSQGTAFYTCRSQDLPHGDPETLSLADKKIYIWWVLNKYEDIMRLTVKPYTEARMKN